jgi:MoaA/NifB/PqqE/SkfB family radical SAM enzyme
MEQDVPVTATVTDMSSADTAIDAEVMARPNGGPLTGAAAEAYVERRLQHPMAALKRFPKFFLIETINTCNARCIMCGIDFDKKAKAVMKDAMFDKIVGEIGRHAGHVEKVMLYLDSEPLLDKKLPARVAKMKAAGVRKVNIATNASLLDERRSRALIEAGLDEIYITIDSMKKDVYERIRVRLDFDEVHDNTLTFIRERDRLNPGVLIRLQMILQELNKDEGPAFRRYWLDRLRPSDQVVVQKVHNWANAVDVMRFGDEDSVNNYPCIALWGTFVVHVHGEAALCCMDTESKHLLGDLRFQSIEEVWTGDNMRRYREMHTGGRRHDIAMCDGCTLWREEKRA